MRDNFDILFAKILEESGGLQQMITPAKSDLEILQDELKSSITGLEKLIAMSKEAHPNTEDSSNSQDTGL